MAVSIIRLPDSKHEKHVAVETQLCFGITLIQLLPRLIVFANARPSHKPGSHLAGNLANKHRYC